jgi:hypothetical protein
MDTGLGMVSLGPCGFKDIAQLAGTTGLYLDVMITADNLIFI